MQISLASLDAFSAFSRDDEVRQGLKEFSNWPTFPQFYVNGDLVGGLDILKEMQENGELEPMVPKKMKLEDRLKTIINQHSLMVFMKGDPANPKCGFSRQLMTILEEAKADFKTFDILRDDEVRQGLKTFSNWYATEVIRPFHCPNLNYPFQAYLSPSVRGWRARWWPRHHQRVTGVGRSGIHSEGRIDLVQSVRVRPF